MANSGNSPKSAARSTPAAQPPASQAGAEQGDALPSLGAERGDIYGLKQALATELGQHSDASNDETGATGDDGADDSANLDTFDAAAEAADTDDAAAEATAASETEAPEGDEAEAESDEAAAEDSPESQPDPAKPADETAAKPKGEGLQARIDELTARAKGAEEQVATLNERLAAYQARDAGRLDAGALDHVDTAQDLQQAEARITAALQWAIRHPDGGKLGEREMSAEEVRDMHAEAQHLLAQAVPARKKHLEERTNFERAAVDFYPWMKDATRGDGAFVHQALQQMPQLRALPNHKLLAADAFVGLVLRQHGVRLTPAILQRLAAEAKPAKHQATAKAVPAAKPRPPAAPARAGVLPPRLAPRAAQAKASQQRLRQGQGTEDDLADSIATKL